MTTQKPELMPEHVWVDDMCTAGTREFGGSTEYTRTDLYDAACADRDALIKALKEVHEVIEASIDGLQSYLVRHDDGHVKWVFRDDPVVNFRDRLRFIVKNAIAAYEKHKGVE